MTPTFAAEADTPLAIVSESSTLIEALGRVATLRSSAIALSDGDRDITYSHLWSAVQSLGQRLREQGVQAGSVVALQLQRGWRQVVAIAAVLETGATFVPVDPAYPVARQSHILADSAVTIIVEEAQPDFAIRHIGSTAAIQAPPGTAYILYTSG